MTNKETTGREEFERIAVELGMHDLTRSGDTYLRDPVHICWQVYQAASCRSNEKQGVDVDWLSNVIRRVDGNNTLGAGALAERIVDALATHPTTEKKDAGNE